jgi:hypothetical protein
MMIIKSIHILAVIGIFGQVSCKKETQNPLPTVSPKFIHSTYNPPITAGWVGQTSFVVDSTFYLDLSVDGDTFPDFRFTIKEWEQPYVIGNTTIILPYQEVGLTINGPQWHLNNIPSFSPAVDSGFVVDSTTFIKGSFLQLVKKYPSYYHTFPAGSKYLTFRKTLDEKSYLYGWMRLRITGVNDIPWEARAVIYIEEVFLSLKLNTQVITGVTS